MAQFRMLLFPRYTLLIQIREKYLRLIKILLKIWHYIQAFILLTDLNINWISFDNLHTYQWAERLDQTPQAHNEST